MRSFVGKTIYIFLNAIPVAIMMALIPKIKDDFLLAVIYVLIIALSLAIRRERRDVIALIFGFIIMTAFEYFFINIGVEKFTRRSLFGLMPIWLPILWAYGFLVVKRTLRVLDRR